MQRFFVRFIQAPLSIAFCTQNGFAPKSCALWTHDSMAVKRSSMKTSLRQPRLAIRIALGCMGMVLCGPASGQALDFSPLKPLHGALKGCQGETCRFISDSLGQALQDLLNDQPREAEWMKPDFLAAVASADGRLMVFTWNWPLPDRTSSYAGLVAHRPDVDAPWEFTSLYDESSADGPDQQQSMRAEGWHGALYYAMVPDAVDKNTWLLLGWDDANAQVTRKVIEPIEWRARGIRFGAPVLQTPKGMVKRHVLEFADAVQVSLRHQPATRGKGAHAERVIFDHLSPTEPHLTGIAAYYGPDMTFDAFVPGKRKGDPWMLVEKVNASEDLPEDRPFRDPRPRNGGKNRR